jgi:hypothetical protein
MYTQIVEGFIMAQELLLKGIQLQIVPCLQNLPNMILLSFLIPSKATVQNRISKRYIQISILHQSR